MYLDGHWNYLFLGHTVEFRDEAQTTFGTNHALQQKMTSQKYPIKVGIWIADFSDIVQSRLVDKWPGFWMVQNLDKSHDFGCFWFSDLLFTLLAYFCFLKIWARLCQYVLYWSQNKKCDLYLKWVMMSQITPKHILDNQILLKL